MVFFLQCNGFESKVTESAASALIEVGLGLRYNVKREDFQLFLCQFESLVLETCRKVFTTKENLVNRIQTGLDNIDKGKRFEFVCQYFKPFLENKSLLDESYLGILTSSQKSNLDAAKNHHLLTLYGRRFQLNLVELQLHKQRSMILFTNGLRFVYKKSTSKRKI